MGTVTTCSPGQELGWEMGRTLPGVLTWARQTQALHLGLPHSTNQHPMNFTPTLFNALNNSVRKGLGFSNLHFTDEKTEFNVVLRKSKATQGQQGHSRESNTRR